MGDVQVNQDGVKYFVADYPNGNVGTPALAAYDEEGVFYYSTDGETWLRVSDNQVATSAQSLYLSAHILGNRPLVSTVVGTFFPKPLVISVIADVTELTNGNVVITAQATGGVNEITLFYSKDGGDYVEYTSGVVFTENGGVVFRAEDSVGNESFSEEFVVGNIDKTE